MEKLQKAMVFVLAGWSGFLVMAVELLSGRILAPDFGSSIYVWGGIITVFMLALALGYLLGGHISVYSPSLSKLGGLVIVAAISIIPVVIFAESILDWLFDWVYEPRYGALLASTILFFLPTTISGAVSPYAIRLLVTRQHDSGKSAGYLYFISTFGSAAGTIATSFYLVLLFEINQILIGMILISSILGLLTLLINSPHHEV